jgi:archaellum component FlaC
LDSIENEIGKSDKSIEGLEWWNEGNFAKQLFERLARIENEIGKSDKYIEELDWWSQGKSTFAKQLFERLDNIEKVFGKMLVRVTA